MKPQIVNQIEKVFDNQIKLNLPKNSLNPLSGVKGYQKDYPKYAVDDDGALIGLNLAQTQLNDDKWTKILALLEANNVRLKVLDLNENQLTSFELTPSLKELEDLDIADNPLESPPEEILRQGNKAVFRFLRDLQEQGAQELYEVKLLIVGEGGTGKTTLWNILQNVKYPVPKQDQEPTIGIQIKEGWKFKHLDHPKEDFLVNLWDFGGQEVQYMTHQFFLTRRSFYVLLADGRREVANFAYWLQIIELLGCEASKESPHPLLVVLNEKGNTIPKMPYDPEQAKDNYPKLNIIKREVDFAKKDDGRIDALVKSIQEVLCRHIDHLPLTIPRLWNDVRQELYELRKSENHIRLSTFEQICKRKGIKDAQQQKDLSLLLHDLGLILHFREDIELADFIILNPQWAVNAVYEIMKHEAVEVKNQGRFDKKLLQEIWDEKEYSIAEQGKLLNLMLKDNLEVCFRAKEGRSEIYIAPQLLPEEKPTGLEWEATPETLRYIYHYPFMPKGIIGRLIVRLHEDIAFKKSKKVVWENGMILEKDRCRAQVQALNDKKTGRQIIKIEVQGKLAENRKGVLRDVRQELETIHKRSFPALTVFQKVPCNCEVCKQSITPYEHDFDRLMANKEKNGSKAIAQCGISFESVPVEQLLEGVFRKEVSFGREGTPNPMVTSDDDNIEIKIPKNLFHPSSKKLNEIQKSIDRLSEDSKYRLDLIFNQVTLSAEKLFESVNEQDEFFNKIEVHLQQLPADIQQQYEGWQNGPDTDKLKAVLNLGFLIYERELKVENFRLPGTWKEFKALFVKEEG